MTAVCRDAKPSGLVCACFFPIHGRIPFSTQKKKAASFSETLVPMYLNDYKQSISLQAAPIWHFYQWFTNSWGQVGRG
jgi:hypothetical protein